MRIVTHHTSLVFLRFIPFIVLVFLHIIAFTKPFRRYLPENFSFEMIFTSCHEILSCVLAFCSLLAIAVLQVSKSPLNPNSNALSSTERLTAIISGLRFALFTRCADEITSLGRKMDSAIPRSLGGGKSPKKSSRKAC